MVIHAPCIRARSESYHQLVQCKTKPDVRAKSLTYARFLSQQNHVYALNDPANRTDIRWTSNQRNIKLFYIVNSPSLFVL